MSPSSSQDAKTMPSGDRPSAAAPPPRARGWPIALVLAVGFGALVIAPAIVLWVVLANSRDHTLALVHARIDHAMSSIIERTRLHLDPARHQTEFIAAMIANGELATDDRARMVDILTASLAAVPQVTAIAFVSPDFQSIRIERGASGTLALFVDLSDSPNIRERIDRTRAAAGSYWGDLIFGHESGGTLINLRTPVRRDGVFAGALVALVSVDELSRFLTAPTHESGTSTFILFDRDSVLAHPVMIDRRFPVSAARPLPDLAAIGDPVLAEIWAPRRAALQDRRLFPGNETGHVVEAHGESWVILHRELAGYGDRPWLVGHYFPLAHITREVAHQRKVALFSAAALALILVVAIFLGRSIGRPIHKLAEAAARLRQLDFDSTPTLRRSRLRELDEAILAFGALRSAMRWFEIYLPRRLVKRLIARGEDRELRSEERMVTILFTDINGYTGLAERMTALETADFLNQHFTLVAGCIEQEDGNIDKYLGDGVMALWGAPDRPEDHADRACRAAIAIAAAIKADNARRRAAGLAPVRLRVGVHTGRVTVGNIGAPGRINYTVVGDAVNAAQRIESLGREFLDDDGEVVVLISGDTLGMLREKPAAEPVGAHPLRGRLGTVEVYRLL